MIQICKMNEKVWNYLEGKGLISSVRSGNDLYAMADDRAQVEDVLECNDHGGNKLINVGMNLLWPSMFHHHPAHEEVFLLSGRDTKPLYIAFAFDGLADFVKKRDRRELKESDFMIVEMVYDHPGFSCFAINPGVLHGEFTCPGEKANPVLIVTEPSDMATDLVDISGIKDMFINAVKRTQEAV